MFEFVLLPAQPAICTSAAPARRCSTAYARHTGGKFVLRVEDTDDARNTREAVDVILDGLRWLGLDWDEGPVSGDAMQESRGDRGPCFQSQRGEIYQRRIQELLDKDLAYEHEGAISSA